MIFTPPTLCPLTPEPDVKKYCEKYFFLSAPICTRSVKFQLSETILWWIEPCGEAPLTEKIFVKEHGLLHIAPCLLWGTLSSILQATSCLSPPTLRVTSLLSCRDLRITWGSWGQNLVRWGASSSSGSSVSSGSSLSLNSAISAKNGDLRSDNMQQ